MRSIQEAPAAQDLARHEALVALLQQPDRVLRRQRRICGRAHGAQRHVEPFKRQLLEPETAKSGVKRPVSTRLGPQRALFSSVWGAGGTPKRPSVNCVPPAHSKVDRVESTPLRPPAQQSKRPLNLETHGKKMGKSMKMPLFCMKTHLFFASF